MRVRHIAAEGLRLRVETPDPAEFLNALCTTGADCSDAECPEEGTLLVTLSPYGEAAARRLAEEQGLSLRLLRRRGILPLLRRVRGHWLLAVLSILLLVLVLELSSRIWELEVTGNETLTCSEILDALAQEGVGIGSSGLHIDNELLRSHMQQRLDRLIWLTVHVHGSRAVVDVRERREKPELPDERTATDVVASKTGLIERLSVLEGKPLVRRGETVLRGQTLITGALADRQGEQRLVHARGDVLARTWYRAAIEFPLSCEEKAYTERKRVRWALKICDLRLNLCFDSGIPYACYDKIQKETRLTLLRMPLPFAVVRTEYIEYTPLSASLTEAEAETAAKDRLLTSLRGQTGGAEITALEFFSERAGERLRVTMTAECLERIGAEMPIPEAPDETNQRE